ncbi:MAG TPA: FAD:protein FMN transferase [Hyphomicrobium sp.]|nr:FAD:protein FMN transferase [Hyphomicrobium sp.]
MRTSLDRRKVITLCAAMGGAALVPLGASRRPGAEPLVEWTGVMLGAVATLRLSHPDRRTGEELLRRAVAEARRLEAIFSIYRDDTAVSELNRNGVLVAPPAELVHLLGLCDDIWRTTGGVFDPTVQPLWRCYADHFASAGADPAGPSREALAAAVKLVGWSNVRFSRDRIALVQRGMGLTLNGIAQGYITDRVVDLLRQEGIGSSLVDMGEIRTVGHRPGGGAWQVAVEMAKSPRTFDLVDKAVATTGASGFQFDAEGRCNHLFNPATGHCAKPATSLSVVAPTAAVADGLSTAFALMDESARHRVLARLPDAQLYVNTEQSLSG